MATGDERSLVTGAAGCTGAWAVRALLDDSVPVVASDLREDLWRLRLHRPLEDGVRSTIELFRRALDAELLVPRDLEKVS